MSIRTPSDSAVQPSVIRSVLPMAGIWATSEAVDTTGEAERQLDTCLSMLQLTDSPVCVAMMAAVDAVVAYVSPTTASELKRQQVFEFIRGLLVQVSATEAFPTGSYPLKTYLPQGKGDYKQYGNVC